ncbi:MAG: glycoside hydrolase family 36 protein [Verrucomicrobiota bacterium]
MPQKPTLGWLALPLGGWLMLQGFAMAASSATIEPTAIPVASLQAQILQAKPSVVLTNGKIADELVVEGIWRDGRWSGSVRNRSATPLAVREIVLFEVDHGLTGDTPVYGESFQMLAQITGTLAQPEDLGAYPDRKHYRIAEPDGYRTASGLLTISPAHDSSLALAFTSCNKFIGRIGFNSSRLKGFLDTEGLTLPPGATWQLESFGVFAGANRDEAVAAVAEKIQQNHPRTLPVTPPTGWCSWYTFYEEVTVPDIERNLAFSKENLPQLRYIQIDDGYQSKMGDWLETGKAFGGNIKTVLKQIKSAGFEPAIWVAPFIAEKTSLVFQQHPDWFVKGSDGKPLDSSTVGFGGWRCAPWYVLDGTHPAVQKHLEQVFKTMREDWGVTYFKLDANYWGAIHGGVHYNPLATRVEAYRQGMAAIQNGAGDSFILGCNAPIWPSLGLVDGMRTSGDINNDWKSIKGCALENLSRAWQNGKLWWNDPDCLLLTENTQKNIRHHLPPKDPTLTENQFKLHVASIRATGGLVLSGDEMPQILKNRCMVLAKLLTPTGMAMHFASPGFPVGRVTLNTHQEEVALFNWSDTPVTRSFATEAGSTITDFWTGESRKADGTTTSCEIAPRSAVLLEITK